MEQNSKERVLVMDEIEAPSTAGMPVLILSIALYILATLGTIIAAGYEIYWLLPICIIYLCLGWIFFCGLKILRPNEAYVLTLFGKYYGTLVGPGFYFVNPFTTAINPAAEANTQTISEAPTDLNQLAKQASMIFRINLNLMKSFCVEVVQKYQKICVKKSNPKWILLA